jgi:PAS domain-containing protein
VQAAQLENGLWTTPKAARKAVRSHAMRDTARKRRLAAAEKHEGDGIESDLESIIVNMPQMLWVTKPNGYHHFYSQRWYDYTGLTREQSMGTGWRIPFHPEDMIETNKRWNSALATGNEYLTGDLYTFLILFRDLSDNVELEYRCRRYDGVWRLMLGRAIPLRDPKTGDIIRWFGK